MVHYIHSAIIVSSMKVLQILTIIALLAVLDLQFVVVECVAQRESAPTAQVVQPDAATVASDEALCKILRKSSNFRDCVKCCGYLDDICLQIKHSHKKCTKKCEKLYPE